MKTLKVIDNQYLYNGVYELKLERNNLDYTSGNCLSLFGKDGQTSRMYSLSSDDRNNNHIKFLIKKFENGEVSSHLTSLQCGDEVKVSNPFGWFKPGRVDNSIFIATGVGISPFLSACRSGLKCPETLYLGVRGFSKDYLYPTMAEIAGVYSRQDIPSKIKVCHSRDRVSEMLNENKKVTHHYNGRVTDIIKYDFDNKLLSSNKKYYLCGNDAMINDVTNLLINNEVAEENIFAETFFNY